MAGEIIEGKRTVIQRKGRRAFELPDQHTIKLRDDLERIAKCDPPAQAVATKRTSAAARSSA